MIVLHATYYFYLLGVLVGYVDMKLQRCSRGVPCRIKPKRVPRFEPRTHVLTIRFVRVNGPENNID